MLTLIAWIFVPFHFAYPLLSYPVTPIARQITIFIGSDLIHAPASLSIQPRGENHAKYVGYRGNRVKAAEQTPNIKKIKSYPNVQRVSKSCKDTQRHF